MPDPSRLWAKMQSLRHAAERSGLRIVQKPELRRDELETWYSEHFRIRSKCVYPWTETRVTPSGDVVLCPFIPQKMGNIRENTLDEILNNGAYRRLRNAIREEGGLFPGCARCCKLYRNVSSRVMTRSEIGAAERFVPLPVVMTHPS
jgi:radical SAM protein with 4Fe4S-binding SPASM domain